ncbi:MAG: O-acetylhomoserine aminocarboxypropyltransferase [Desulfurella sp.]|uniref:O-acetylhomoserine aminocarboxypropyltransferase/cysteine synthase family protein n=1 Tax=Desulfurella sp. TaxID=1962857 RepID=UPI000CBEF7E0|nr:O-acetylhomoserine aminocarboxypropyltransferase/cysteine synthase family protein [Desulfurella sp.]PMP89770.1 MAG: O-acetylhomoserine aminocarboxypropyltransferase [Desulfurella sp.]
MKTETILLHYGYKSDNNKSQAIPIYQTSSYRFDSIKDAYDLFTLNKQGNIYTRINNPTVGVLEERLAAMHNAKSALVVSSGQAAILYSILNLASFKDNIVSSKYLYGGTYNLFKYTLKRIGIETRFAQTNNITDFEKLIDNHTKAVYIESIGNPTNKIADFIRLSAMAHNNNIPLIVDNTVSPIIFNPFDFGADIIVYSLTKFISGNGTSIGGAIVEKGDFDWSNLKFNNEFSFDKSYHGLSYIKKFKNSGVFTAKARLQLLRDIGACISPFNAFLILLGLETLPLRIEKHCKNALKVARFLSNRPKVSWTNHLSLPNHPDRDLADKYFKKGFGSIIGFGVNGGFEKAKAFVESLKLIIHLANIGDARSLIIHPASTTHSQLTKEELKKAQIGEDFLRLSVGIEHVDDIIDDLNQSLEKI